MLRTNVNLYGSTVFNLEADAVTTHHVVLMYLQDQGVLPDNNAISEASASVNHAIHSDSSVFVGPFLIDSWSMK